MLEKQPLLPSRDLLSTCPGRHNKSHRRDLSCPLGQGADPKSFAYFDALAGATAGTVATAAAQIQAGPEVKCKSLVFGNAVKAKLDPFRGVAVNGDSDMARWFKGALDGKDETPEKRLPFFFK